MIDKYRLQFRSRHLVNKLLYHLLFKHLYHKWRRFENIYKVQNYSIHSIRFMIKATTENILGKSDLLDEDKIAIDVGGETGIWSEGVSKQYNPNLYIFEPNPRSLDVLKKKFKSPKVHIIPYGLSGKTENASLSLLGMGSSTEESSPNYKNVGKVEIEL